MTKAQERMLENYNRSRVWNLDQIYGRYSINKARAYCDCVERMNSMQGYDQRIPTHNQQVFTFAFRYEKDGKEWLHYETACYIHDFEIEKGVI